MSNISTIFLLISFNTSLNVNVDSAKFIKMQEYFSENKFLQTKIKSFFGKNVGRSHSIVVRDIVTILDEKRISSFENECITIKDSTKRKRRLKFINSNSNPKNRLALFLCKGYQNYQMVTLVHNLSAKLNDEILGYKSTNYLILLFKFGENDNIISVNYCEVLK
jgi:hypothetical protein